MPRTMSTAESDLLAGKSYRVAWRVQVADSTGAFQNLADLGDINWCTSAEWRQSIDQPVTAASIILRRDSGGSTGKSLSPLDTDSTFNLNSTGGYAALLWAGREVKIETATIALGSTPGSTDYKTMFWGEVDRVDWESADVLLTARDRLFAHLQDRWVESTGHSYGTVDGRAVESVMADLTSDWTDASTTLAVYTPSSPGFLIAPPYWAEIGPVLGHMTDLADLVGWYVRPTWVDASSAFRVTFAEPNRSASTADFTFGGDRYLNVRALAIDRTRVRNAINISWFSTAGTGSSTSVTDAASIAEYGRRWLGIQEPSGGAISSSSEASTLATAVLNDLKDPEAEFEIDTFYFWAAELDDYYGFSANAQLFTSTQLWGLSEIRHRLTLNEHRTTLRVRGQPAAGNLRWGKKGGSSDGGPSTSIDPSAEPLLTSLTLAEFNSTNGKYTIASQVPGINSIQWKLWERDSTGSLWPTTDGSSASAVDDSYLRGTFPIDRGDAGLHSAASSAGTRYAIAVGVNSAGRVGPRKQASLAISTSTAGAGAGTFYEFYATPGTSGCVVRWSHDDTIGADSTDRYVYDLYRLNLGSIAQVTLVTGGDPKDDHSGSVTGQGSYLDTDLVRCSSGVGDSCSYYSFTYRAVLRDTSTTSPYADKEYSYPVGESFDNELSQNLL